MEEKAWIDIQPNRERSTNRQQVARQIHGDGKTKELKNKNVGRTTVRSHLPRK